MADRYSKEFHAFMQEFVKGHTAKEISEEIYRRFGIDVSPAKVKSYKTNHKLSSGTQGGIAKGTPSKEFPEEIQKYINETHTGVGYKDMANRLYQIFGRTYRPEQIRAYYKNHHIKCGLTGRYEKGHVPYYKGKKIEHPHPNSVKTQFAAGHTPANKMPIGSVVMKAGGYLWRKIGSGAREWRQEHILIYEQAYGAIPEGAKITFLDGDHTNLDLNNLRLISNDVNLELNRSKLRVSDPKLQETAINVAKLKCKMREIKKG